MTNETSIEELIVALNQYKRKKSTEEIIKDVNSLQRKLEERCGRKAVEIEEDYDYKYGVTD
jgi:hypothetical protein